MSTEKSRRKGSELVLQVRFRLAQRGYTLASLADEHKLERHHIYNALQRFCGKTDTLPTGYETTRAIAALAWAAGAEFFPPVDYLEASPPVGEKSQ